MKTLCEQVEQELTYQDSPISVGALYEVGYYLSKVESLLKEKKNSQAMAFATCLQDEARKLIDEIRKLD